MGKRLIDGDRDVSGKEELPDVLHSVGTTSPLLKEPDAHHVTLCYRASISPGHSSTPWSVFVGPLDSTRCVVALSIGEMHDIPQTRARKAKMFRKVKSSFIYRTQPFTQSQQANQIPMYCKATSMFRKSNRSVRKHHSQVNIIKGVFDAMKNRKQCEESRSHHVSRM